MRNVGREGRISTIAPGTDDLRRQLVDMLPRLRRFCLTLARDSVAADDLCQATVERALSRAQQFKQGTRLDSWMYRIAQNLHIDDIRRRQTRGTEIDIDETRNLSGGDGLRLVEGRSDLAMARAALAGLPEDQRSVVALVVIDGMSYRDAAETLDVPPGTIMSRLSRARRAIDMAVNGAVNGDIAND